MASQAQEEAPIPPPLQGPTAKEKRYDRQLRLWAASGQQALEESHVLLLNNGSGVAGVETLKNLILPGIGEFTIVDDCVVDEQDLGVNFFLHESSLGKPRAHETMNYLRELNPEVKGNAIQTSTSNFIQSGDLTKYTLVLLVSPADVYSVVESISKTCWDSSIPLFWIHCLGFYFTFTIQLPKYFPIVDTHPDPVSTQDLRLLKPWSELIDHMKKKTSNLNEMSDHDHGHVPYLLLLLHYLQEWYSEHGKYPETYGDKTAFRKVVQASARTSNPEGGEENYDEAVAAVLKSLNSHLVPSSLNSIWEMPECLVPEPNTSSFFIIALALRQFHQENGALPLPGSIPDMKAQSSDYIELQNLYRAKSQSDIDSVTALVRAIESSISRSSLIPSKEIEAFCKGASWVKLISGRRLVFPSPHRGDASSAHTYHLANMQADARRAALWELRDPESKLAIHLAALGLDAVVGEEQAWADASVGKFTTWEHYMGGRFREHVDGERSWHHVGEVPSRAFDRLANGERMLLWQFAGELNDGDEVQITRDYKDSGYIAGLLFAQTRAGARELFEGLPMSEDKERAIQGLKEVCDEMARSGPAEMHNIASLAGGMVAQEVIKVITKQYVPVDNTCIFDGIKSSSQVLRL